MAADRPSVCVVGSINVDLVVRAAQLPRPGETLPGRDFQVLFGGKGANQAVAAARLGARTAFVGRVGGDAFGEQALENLRREGIDTLAVGVDDASRPTGVAFIAVDDAGANSIVVVAGANGGLTSDAVLAASSVISSADVVLCQLEVPLEATRAMLAVARSAGAVSIFNPAPAVPFPDDVLALADLCVPNETEASALTGLEVTTADQACAAANALRRRGARTVLVTLGAQGVVVVDGEGSLHLPAVPVEVVDSTGAGDAFIGALAVFLAEGLPLGSAARRACAAAALSVTRAGAQAALPSRAVLDAFVAKQVP